MRTLIRSRRIALPLAALALAGTGVAAYGAVGDDSPSYRTVHATVGSVEQELTVSGVIEPAGSSDLAFGTGGTVARVAVAQGDEVEEGDVVAVLDRASLRAAVDKARSGLASATAQLAEDRDAQTSAVTTASDATTSSAATSPAKSAAKTSTKTSTKAPASAVDVRQLTAQQDAVVKAQSSASRALSAARTALTAQQEACADPVTTEPTQPTQPVEPAETATDGATTEPAASAVLSQDCTDALAAVQSAQSTASEAQTALQTALETLSGTLTEALAAVQDSATASPSAASTPAASTPTAPEASGGTGGTGGAGPTVTAATLAQDQASIDKARAELASARADLAGAVVRAPADGTVVDLAVAAGSTVAAGDTVATVVAPGLTTVAAEVSATQAARLKAGLDVEVTPAGATDALKGAVSRVEHVPTSTTSEGADPTYLVQVVLDDRDLGLADGMPATVAAVVGAAEDVVVVPASAVHDGSVTVVEDGRARQVRVTTGIVGATAIEVTDGLDAGDEVVLADLDADLPSGDSEQGPGGFGGGGFPGGGTPPAGFRMRG